MSAARRPTAPILEGMDATGFDFGARRGAITLAIVVLATGIIVATHFASGPRGLAEAGRLSDDSFVYMVVADSFAERGALEFYPGMPTNGAQPLWMATLATARTAMPGVGADWLTLLLTGLFFTAGAAAWAWLLRSRFNESIALGFLAVTALSPPFQAFVLQGLETSLLWLLLPVHFACLLAALDREDVSFLPGLAAGLTAGLVFLTRADALTFVITSVGVFALIRRWRSLAGVIIGSAVLALPYLIANVVYFGGLVPLSARAKQFHLGAWLESGESYWASTEWWGLADALRTWPIELWQIHSGAMAVLFMFVGIGVVMVAFRQWTPWSQGERGGRLLVMLAFPTFLHTVLMFGYHRELRPQTSYDFLPELLIFWLSAVLVLHARMPRYTDKPERVWAGVAAICFVLSLASSPQPREFGTNRIAMADHVREHVAAEATVGAYSSGALAWFAGRPIVPLDGVSASRAYQDEVMMQSRELADLCTRPDPHLVIDLGQSPAEFAKTPHAVGAKDWSHAGPNALIEFGLERSKLVTSFGTWGLFTLDCAPR